MCLWQNTAQNGNQLDEHNLQPRYVYYTTSVNWLPIVIVIIVVKLIIIASILVWCSRRRRRRRDQALRFQQQPLHPQSSSLLPPAYQPPVSNQTRSVPNAQCTETHVAGRPCNKCAATVNVSAKRAPADRPRCHNIHLPWKKCPTCHVDPPREGHIELAAESAPGGPHEMNAHVPAWQGQPQYRAENYGGFYAQSSDPAAITRPNQSANPHQTVDQINMRNLDTRQLTTAPVVSPLASPQRPARPVVTVGDGHKSYATYSAVSGQPPLMDSHHRHHSRTRSVSPAASVERNGPSIELSPVAGPKQSEGDATRTDITRAYAGEASGANKTKSSEGLLSRYFGS